MSLSAVILVGGLGTRLRPLTDRTRKDMLPLVDRPQLAYTFEHLRRHGVTRAIVSCGYLPTQIQEHFGDRYGELRLEYKIEEEPLGTGGAIRFAAEGIDEPFFALNGDSLRETDLDALVAFHRERPTRATILLTPVEDPTRYGLVRVNGDGQVLELPREAAPGGDRHEPDQRGPVRARAGRARPDPAGPSRFDRARGLPASRRGAGGLRDCARAATGSTSGRRTPICRRIATCSSGTSPPSSASALGLRLHARRPDGRGQPRCAARAAGLRGRGRDDRRRRSHRQPRGDRSGRPDRRRRVHRVVRDRRGRRRRPAHARRGVDRRRAGPRSEPAARCAASASSDLARRSATGICSTTGCASRRTRRIAAGAVSFS